LEEMAQFLEPFNDLTKKISGSNYSTVFLIIPLFNIIIDHIEDLEFLSKQQKSKQQQ